MAKLFGSSLNYYFLKPAEAETLYYLLKNSKRFGTMLNKFPITMYIVAVEGQEVVVMNSYFILVIRCMTPQTCGAF